MHQVHLALETPMLGPGTVLGFANPGQERGKPGGTQPSEPLQDQRPGGLSMKSPGSGRKTDLPRRPSQPAHRDGWDGGSGLPHCGREPSLAIVTLRKSM